MQSIGFLQTNTTKTTKDISTIVPTTFTHSCAIGETGCGKTTSYIYPNLAQRIKKGHSILMYDYKGKEHLALKAISDKYGRLADLIEIGAPWGRKINLIKYMNEAEFRNFVINLTGLNDKDPYWSTTASNVATSIYKTIKKYLKVISEANKLNRLLAKLIFH